MAVDHAKDTDKLKFADAVKRQELWHKYAYQRHHMIEVVESRTNLISRSLGTHLISLCFASL